MRVMVNCLLARGPETGGGFTFLTGLLEALARSDRENEYLLVVAEANRHSFEFGADNFRHVTLPAVALRSVPRIFAESVLLPALARRHRADLFFGPNDTLPNGLPCPSIVGAQNLIYYAPPEYSIWRGLEPRQRLRAQLQRQYYLRRTPDAMRRAHRILAISHETRRQILANVRGVAAERIAVIYPGAPRWTEGKSVRNGNNSSAGPPFFLSTSTLMPYKNFERLIEAFATFAATGVGPHRLVIVGRALFPAYQLELAALAQRLGVSERVDFPGFVAAAELVDLYRNTTAFVLLSSCESFGFPVVEAMSCGAATVVSNVSTLPEIAAGAGVAVDPADTRGLAALLERLVAEPGYRDELRARSLVRARDFTWSVAADQFRQLAAETVAAA